MLLLLCTDMAATDLGSRLSVFLCCGFDQAVVYAIGFWELIIHGNLTSLYTCEQGSLIDQWKFAKQRTTRTVLVIA